MGPLTLQQASAQGHAGQKSLDNNDSATFLDAAESLVHTGPTHTNINNFRAVLIL
jgi:glycerate 2-kinase